MMDKPEPGSKEAIAQGCTCPILENWRRNQRIGAEPDFVYAPDCPVHGKINRGKRLREKRRAAGLCILCGHGIPEKGYAQCPECLAKKRAYSRANNAETRAYLKSKGICPHCGVRPAKPGRVCCETCIQREVARNRAKREIRAYEKQRVGAWI